MRNNRYGPVAAYLAWALEILIGLDPLDSVHSLADGSTVESLLVGHLPVEPGNLTRLRGEVREMFARVDAMVDPPQQMVDAVRNMGGALSVIEQTLLAE
jgi:hypothetical protein